MQTFAKLPMRRPRASAKSGQSAPGASASAPVSACVGTRVGNAAMLPPKRGPVKHAGAVRLPGRPRNRRCIIAPHDRGRRSEGACLAPPPGRPVFTLVALAATVSVVFLAFMLAATQGHVRPPGRRPLPRLPVRAGRSWRDIRSGTTPARPPPPAPPACSTPSGWPSPRRSAFAGRDSIAFAIVCRRGFYVASVLLARAVATRLGGTARRDAGRDPGRPRRAGRVVLHVRIGHRAVPVPRAVAASSGGWPAPTRGRPSGRCPGVLLALARPEGLPIASRSWPRRGLVGPAARPRRAVTSGPGCPWPPASPCSPCTAR